jgi:hypothetical protein
MTAPRTATYLYCLVQSRRPPACEEAPPGLEGTGPLRGLRAAGDLWLIAATAPLPRYGAEAIERGLRDLEWVSRCALAHEAVVEHFAAVQTVLPMRLFTLFHDDQGALDHIQKSRARITRLLGRLSGRQEWGVRVRLNGSKPAPAPARRAALSGTGFLLAKRQEHTAGRTAATEARRQADRVFRELKRLAAASRRRDPVGTGSGARLVLDAAFLVDRKGGTRFRRAVRSLAGRLEPTGCAVELTGPWPPYNFIAGGS